MYMGSKRPPLDMLKLFHSYATGINELVHLVTSLLQTCFYRCLKKFQIRIVYDLIAVVYYITLPFTTSM
jgi:hypothetical protein